MTDFDRICKGVEIFLSWNHPDPADNELNGNLIPIEIINDAEFIDESDYQNLGELDIPEQDANALRELGWRFSTKTFSWTFYRKTR